MQAVAEGYELIVAAGGDGTVNEVVNGIGRSGVALGVLPLGTANVFARALGVPLELNAAWTVIERGRTLAIDLPVAQVRRRGAILRRTGRSRVRCGRGSHSKLGVKEKDRTA